MDANDLWRQWRYTFSALACINAVRAQVDCGPRDPLAMVSTALVDLADGGTFHVQLPLDRELFLRRTPDGAEYRAMEALYFGHQIECMAEHPFSTGRVT